MIELLLNLVLLYFSVSLILCGASMAYGMWSTGTDGLRKVRAARVLWALAFSPIVALALMFEYSLDVFAGRR